MPWSGTAGSQTFSRATGVYNGSTCWDDSRAGNRGIRSDDHDYHDQDIAAGLSACLKRDGGNTASANIPMGGFKFTGLGPATANGDAVRYEQLPTSVMTTRGDMDFYGASGIQRLAKGTAGHFLVQGANDPQWSAVTSYLGTAAQYNLGTSGATVPYCSGAITWSGASTFSAANNFTGGNHFKVPQNFHPTLSGDGAVAMYCRHTNPSSTAIQYFNVGAPAPTASNAWIWFVVNDTTVIGSILSTVIGPAPFVGGSTSYNTTSDGRLKPEEYRRPITDSGDIIDRLNPIRFRWGSAEGPEDFGFVAQEVAAIVPDAVIKGDDGPYKEDLPMNGGSTPWQMERGRLEPFVIAELKSLEGARG